VQNISSLARILNGFRLNSLKLITATSRLNDYYLAKLEERQASEQDTTELFEWTLIIGVAVMSNRC